MRLKGKGITGSKNWMRIEVSQEAAPGEKGFRRRAYRKGTAWPTDGTPLRSIERFMAFPLQREVAKLVAKGGKRKPVIVDWGCGTGRAVIGLAKLFPESAEFYGFADQAYKGWMKNRNVKFIHGVENDFGRYFRNGSIDLMYSHFGLSHVPSLKGSYIQVLLPKLRVGGKLVMTVKNLDFSELPKNRAKSASASYETFQLRKGGKKLSRYTTTLMTRMNGMNFKITYPEEERMVADKIIFERLK